VTNLGTGTILLRSCGLRPKQYFKSLANCAAIAREVDRLYVYDNSVDSREPQLVFRALEGQIVKSYISHPLWTAPIANEMHSKE
jgi:predicted ABC-type ATPase